MTQAYNGMAETYGNPGPEGPMFWGFLAVVAAIIFLAIGLEPLYGPLLNR